ncbi:hypothetical protein BVC80_8863g22 [Macleaya cordata]|uniref:Uncharacterized protein n=1 Tax=Macleaya cordata TaxID=56857 RepID=A0A200Q5D3_MACCD|nr:hypothetical protein BVC80_8863g22 [Macleaya cordata]
MLLSFKQSTLYIAMDTSLLHKKYQLDIIEESSSHAEASPVLFVVFMVVILATTSFLRLKDQTKKDSEVRENIAEITPVEQSIIDISNTVSIPGSPLDNIRQVLDTSSGLSGVSQNIMVEQVESNENVASRDQNNGDISDIASLLHQPLIAGQETSSFHIEHLNNLLPEPEAQERTSEIANSDWRTTSQPAGQPTQAAAVAGNEAHIPELKTAAKVSYWVMPISAGGIVSILAGLIGDKKTDLAHKVVLFNAYKSLTFISFVLGVLLFLLTTIKPASIPRLVVIVKITMWLTLGSITYAITCATSIILVKSLFGVVIVLIVPLVIVFVLIIVTFSSRRT